MNARHIFLMLFSASVYLAILVTGGWTSATVTTAEVILTNGTALCNIEDLPERRYYHTQNGPTVCGGSYTRRSCIQYKEGSWITLVDDLVHWRYYHSSWMMNQEGDIMLIGGSVSQTTTEIVYQNGTNIRSFDLKYAIE